MAATYLFGGLETDLDNPKLTSRTMSIINSHNSSLDSIFVNNTVTSGTAGERRAFDLAVLA